MLLERIELADIRSYERLTFEPAPGLNLIAGGNAQGKTNLLEAIALLGMGRSFRTAADREIVREGATAASVHGLARLAHGTSVRLSCTIELRPQGARKRYALGGEEVRFVRYLGRLRVVTFAPGDVALAAGAPALRRSFLNAALSQESAGYHEALITYARALAQKNALLRGGVAWDASLLDVYDAQLAPAGRTLLAARAAFVDELGPAARAAYRAIAPCDEELRVGYRPNTPAGELEDALLAARPLERMRRRALTGPHRDELELRLGERPLALYGSQAQLRSTALSLKLGELAVAAARSGDPALGLLDDVLSELDPERQTALVRLLEDHEQAFVTTAGALPPGRHALFGVGAGRIERRA